MAEDHVFQLAPIHYQAAMLIAQGHKHVDVIEKLGLGATTISLWMRSSAFRKKIAEYRDKIIEEIHSYSKDKIGMLQADAVDELERLLKYAESESVRLGAIDRVLDRGPLRVEKGVPSIPLMKGTVIMQERMLIAIKNVGELTGDQEILDALPQLPEGSTQE